MLTSEAMGVDGGSSEELRVSVTELAEIKGVSKQAISKRLDRLIGDGLIEVKKRGREKTVSLAEWDTVTNEVTDPAKLAGRDTTRAIEDEATGGNGAAAPEKDPTYTQAITRKARLDADLKEIEVEKQKGTLLAIDDVRASMERCAELIVRDIDQLPSFADDLAAAVAKGGVGGLREALKVKARQLRETLARSMSLAATTDEEPEEIEEST